MNPKNQQNYVKLGLNSNGNSLLSVEAFSDKDKIGLSVPALYSKYAVVNLKDAENINDKQVSIAKGTFNEGDTKIEGRVITVNKDKTKNLIYSFKGKDDTGTGEIKLIEYLA